MDNSYFGPLNYTLANEDSRLEYQLLDEGATRVLAIAGSGSRIVPLIAKGPSRLVCVDVSPAQLHLTELRIAALKALPLDDYLLLLGYPTCEDVADDRRAAVRRHLFQRLDLSVDARNLLDDYFPEEADRPLIYQGRWEQAIARLAQMNRRVTGNRGAGLFDQRTLEDQGEYRRNSFPERRWRMMIYILGNAPILNALIYRGSFPKRNLDRSHYNYYRDALDRIMESAPARENYFLQMLFFGHLKYRDGLPFECDPQLYAAAQQRVHDVEIEYQRGDVFQGLEGPFDFASLSDVPSYLDGAEESSFLQRLRPTMAVGGKVVCRYHLRKPEGVDEQGFTCHSDRYQNLLMGERTHLYHYGIFERSPRLS